jgi:CRP-like cAMP-binding protein
MGVVMKTTLGEARVKAWRHSHAGDLSRTLTAYCQILSAVPFDFQTRLRIADILARGGQAGPAAEVYQAVARHHILSGHPLPAIVACTALARLGDDPGPLLEQMAEIYGAGSPRLARFGARPAPLAADTVLAELDLEYPDDFEVVAQEARALAVDFSKSPPFPEQLQPLPFLSELPPGPFRAVVETVQVWRLTDGELVAKEGDPGDALYLLAAGEARVFIKDGAGERTVARLHENTLFGEMALATGEPRKASVAAVYEADVIAVSRHALQRITEQLPIVRDVLDRFTRQRLIKNLMQTSPLFAPFSRAQQSDLLRRFEGHEVEAEVGVIEQGAPGVGLFVVLSGALEVVAQAAGTSRAAPVVLARLGSGDVFGEMSLLSSQPSAPTTAAVRTVAPSTLLFLARSHFDELMATVPDLRSYFETLAARRTRDNSTKLGSQPLPEEGSAADVLL